MAPLFGCFTHIATQSTLLATEASLIALEVVCEVYLDKRKQKYRKLIL